MDERSLNRFPARGNCPNWGRRAPEVPCLWDISRNGHRADILHFVDSVVAAAR
ncbi:MAG TPA: hypothetical protein VH475_15875 [Tepidisphaeraceae bacterium]